MEDLGGQGRAGCAHGGFGRIQVPTDPPRLLSRHLGATRHPLLPIGSGQLPWEPCCGLCEEPEGLGTPLDRRGSAERVWGPPRGPSKVADGRVTPLAAGWDIGTLDSWFWSAVGAHPVSAGISVELLRQQGPRPASPTSRGRSVHRPRAPRIIWKQILDSVIYR